MKDKFCYNCGHKLSEHALFCSNCGAKQNNSSSGYTTQSKENSSFNMGQQSSTTTDNTSGIKLNYEVMGIMQRVDLALIIFGVISAIFFLLIIIGSDYVAGIFYFNLLIPLGFFLLAYTLSLALKKAPEYERLIKSGVVKVSDLAKRVKTSSTIDDLVKAVQNLGAKIDKAIDSLDKDKAKANEEKKEEEIHTKEEQKVIEDLCSLIDNNVISNIYLDGKKDEVIILDDKVINEDDETEELRRYKQKLEDNIAINGVWGDVNLQTQGVIAGVEILLLIIVFAIANFIEETFMFYWFSHPKIMGFVEFIIGCIILTLLFFIYAKICDIVVFLIKKLSYDRIVPMKKYLIRESRVRVQKHFYSIIYALSTDEENTNNSSNYLLGQMKLGKSFDQDHVYNFQAANSKISESVTPNEDCKNDEPDTNNQVSEIDEKDENIKVNMVNETNKIGENPEVNQTNNTEENEENPELNQTNEINESDKANNNN